MNKADLAMEKYVAGSRAYAAHLTLAHYDAFAPKYRPPTAKPKSDFGATVAAALAMAAKGAARPAWM
jgi:hypothetical protein